MEDLALDSIKKPGSHENCSSQPPGVGSCNLPSSLCHRFRFTLVSGTEWWEFPTNDANVARCLDAEANGISRHP